MKHLKNKQRKKLFTAARLALCLALLLSPFRALATDAYFPEYGVSMYLPASLDVFTQNMASNDPVLQLYGLSPDIVSRQLQSRGLVLEAQDIAGDFIVEVSITYAQGQSISQLTQDEINSLAASLGGSAADIITTSQTSFIQVRHQNGRQVTWQGQAGSLRFRMTLIANVPVKKAMLNLGQNILNSTDFGLMQ